jgi:peptide/nickel transport system substrate-binding protein
MNVSCERSAVRWRVLSAVAVTLALAAGACGDDDDPSSASAPATNASAPATSASETATSASAPASSAPATSASETAPSTSGVDASTTTAADAAEETPVSGGQATYLFQSEMGATFDPVKLISVSSSIGDGTAGFNVYGSLVGTDPLTREVHPHMAESLTSDDGSVWTLKLRDGVKFSDGTDFDAEAVKFNWERHADPANTSSSRGVVAAMQAIEVVDPLTLRITLTEPNQQFPRTLGQYTLTFIASPTAIRAGTVGEKPVGAGPFLLKEWVRDDHMTFVRNPTYWDAPRPYLDELTIRPIIDPAQRLNAAITGQGQVAFLYNPTDAESAADEGLELHHIKMNGGQTIIFNFASPLGADERFRRALRLAIDNAQLSEIVARGAGTDDATTFFTEDSPLYNPSLRFPEPDLAEAQRLIDELASERGGTLEFTLNASQPQQTNADAIQTQLAQFDNLKVNLNIQSAAAHPKTVIVDKAFEVALWNTFNLDPEPRSHDFFLTGSPRNYSNGYSDPEMDAALKKGRQATTEAERQAAYDEMQQIIIDTTPVIVISRADHYIATNEKIHGAAFIEDGVMRWDQVWID